MKRSEINAALKELEAMCQKYSCFLPPFCHFTPEEWQEKGHGTIVCQVASSLPCNEKLFSRFLILLKNDNPFSFFRKCNPCHHAGSTTAHNNYVIFIILLYV